MPRTKGAGRKNVQTAISNKAKGETNNHYRTEKHSEAVAYRKAKVLDGLREGKSINQSCKSAGLNTNQQYYYWLKNDERFAAEAHSIRTGEPIDFGAGRNPVPDFPEFSDKYLGQPLFSHQLQWFDVLEGREPRDLHPSATYVPNDLDLLVVNTPPGHAKTTTITVNYTTWRIVSDPSTKVLLVSNTARLAYQFLYAIKTRLTGPAYQDMQREFGPAGGYDADSASWKQDLIYISANARRDGEKDPTVQALGIGGQVYGSRADLIIIDDSVVNSNANDYEKQMHWLQTEVLSRIPDGGKVIVVGTRMASKDLYRELLDPNNYVDNESPWTYFAQPAVLEFAEKPEDWKTLWPYTSEPATKGAVKLENGLYPKWTGEVLAKRRKQINPTQWARVYQQEQVAEDNVFDPELISRCTGSRTAGIMAARTGPQDNYVDRDEGMRGLFIVGGLDPAASGHSAFCIVGYDPKDEKRYVIDVHNEAAMTPDAMRNKIKEWTLKYGVNEWRIEKNAFQRFLTLDSEIRTFLASHGCVLHEHTTGRNKNDESFGVMAMEGLFRQGLISLPRPTNEGVKALVEQLTIWHPDAPKHQKTDCVMALWFAELKCIDMVQRHRSSVSFLPGSDEFMTRSDRQAQQIVRL